MRHIKSMAALVASTVASLLRDGATRAALLEAFEQHEAAIDRAVSLAATPALYELLAADATEVGRDDFDRIALLLVRLFAEAIDDASELCGVALGDGRYAAVLHSKGSVLAQAMTKPASELTQADARSFAYSVAWHSACFARGVTKPLAAAGFPKTADWVAIFMGDEWFCK